jgi:hypothetical protein
MSNAVITPLAEAVTAELNAPLAMPAFDFTAFSQSFTATRVYNPEVKEEDLEDLSVQVQSGRVASEPAERDEQQRDCDVILYFRQQIVETDLATIDALIALVEEVDRYLFRLQRPRTFSAAHWQASEITPVIPKRVRGQVYEGILVVTYRVFDGDA